MRPTLRHGEPAVIERICPCGAVLIVDLDAAATRLIDGAMPARQAHASTVMLEVAESLLRSCAECRTRDLVEALAARVAVTKEEA